MSCSVTIKQICEFSTAPPSTRHLYLHHSGTHAAAEKLLRGRRSSRHHDVTTIQNQFEFLNHQWKCVPVAASLLVVLFLGFHGSCAVHWWLTVLECVFKGAMCSVHSWMLYFYVKIPTGTRIARVSDLRPSCWFCRRSWGGVRKKAVVVWSEKLLFDDGESQNHTHT